jgi:DNA-binding Xre family transcriptional regulator
MLLKDRKLLGRLVALQGWSARSLATAAGFQSHTYMVRLINGKANSCSPERALAICAQLQVPVDTLFVTKLSSHNGRSGQQSAA